MSSMYIDIYLCVESVSMYLVCAYVFHRHNIITHFYVISMMYLVYVYVSGMYVCLCLLLIYVYVCFCVFGMCLCVYVTSIMYNKSMYLVRVYVPSMYIHVYVFSLCI